MITYRFSLLLVNACGSWFCFYGCFCVVVAFAKQAVDNDKDDDSGQAASAKFFGAPASNDGSKKVVHDLLFIVKQVWRRKVF